MSYSVSPSSFQSITSRAVRRYSCRSAFGSEDGTAAVCHRDRSSPMGIECCSELFESLGPPVVPVGELIVSLPPPGRDHRPDENAALVDDVLIRPRIVLADLFGTERSPVLVREHPMSDGAPDRTAAARLEVDEEQPGLCS